MNGSAPDESQFDRDLDEMMETETRFMLISAHYQLTTNAKKMEFLRALRKRDLTEYMELYRKIRGEYIGQMVESAAYCEKVQSEYEKIRDQIPQDLSGYKVRDLIQLCDSCNINHSGRKSELLDRIEQFRRGQPSLWSPPR